MASNTNAPFSAPEPPMVTADALLMNEGIIEPVKNEEVRDEEEEEASRKRDNMMLMMPAAGPLEQPNFKRIKTDNEDVVTETIQQLHGSLEEQDKKPQAKSTYKRRSWDQRFEELKEYRKEHGNCLVPQKYKLNPKLGRWVENQRSQYNRYMKSIQSGKPNPTGSMNAERIAMLEQVDFVWKVGRGRNGGETRRRSVDPKTIWEQRFAELKAFKEEQGHCNVPARYKVNPQLGMWVATQRSQYRIYKESGAATEASSGMNEERIGKLQGIDFSFVLLPGWDDDAWNARLEELKAFKAQHGHVDVPADDAQLGEWVRSQRSQYALYTKEIQAGSLDPSVAGMTADRIAKLTEVGFPWRAGNEEPAGIALSHQVAAEASNDEPLKLSASLSHDQPLPAEDATYQAVVNTEWTQRIQELQAFKAEHGHMLVPTKYEKNPKLGRFVSNQRAQYHNYLKAKESGRTDLTTRRLNEERIAELEAIGFVWAAKGKGGEDQNARKRWDMRYEELKAYKNEHGDCMVPTKYALNQQLARWVGNQRAHYSLYMKAKEAGTKDALNTGMSDERIALLEEIGFAWSGRPASEVDSWKTRLAELEAFRAEHGDCLVPRNYPANQKLANFVSNVRTHYRFYVKAQETGSAEGDYSFMTAERVAQLDELGFAWNLRKRRHKKEDEAVTEAYAAEDSVPAPAAAAAAPSQPAPVEGNKQVDVWAAI